MKLYVLLLLFLLPFVSGFAETFPRYSVRTMCHMAEAIIVGSVLEGDTVRVEKWIRPHPPSDTPFPETITIKNLSNHLRTHDWRLGSGPPASRDLPLRRFVAFLEGSGQTWECLSTLADSGTRPGCGSSGLIWIYEGACYGYSQYTSPGPYLLFSVADMTKGIWERPYVDWLEPVTTEALLRAEIDAGLKDAAAWRDVLAEPDAVKKAHRLASYYVPGTSPVGKRKTFLFEIENHLRELDDLAVPALVEALRSRQPGDDLTALFWTLRRFPANTEATIPELSKLLGAPLARPPYYAIECLGYTESPQILPALWSFLLSPYSDVREEAEKAVRCIAPDSLSPSALAKTSPIIAIVRTFPPAKPSPSDPASPLRPVARATVQQNLKGHLPEELFLIEAPAETAYDKLLSRKFFGSALVFLRQDEQGRFLLSTPESLKDYSSDAVRWPREHSIRLEKIRAAISAPQQDLSPGGS